MGQPAADVVARCLEQVHDDPRGVVATADDLLSQPGGSAELTAGLLWARGLARRESGEPTLGAEDLRRASEVAAATSPVLAARIDTSRALAVLSLGSAGDALALLERAEPVLTGSDLGRLYTQRGLIGHRTGDLASADRWYSAAERRFRRTDDRLGQARLLNNWAILHAQRGRLRRAEQTAGAAAELADDLGQRFIAAGARHNRGYARGRFGRIPEAWADLEAAERTYRDLGRWDLVFVAQVDLSEVLLGANLTREAADLSDRAVRGVRRHGDPTNLGDALLLRARCLLAAGQHEEAAAALAEADHHLRGQERHSLLALGRFTRLLLASEGPTSSPGGTTSEADLAELASTLEAHGWVAEAVAAWLLAARRALRSGDHEQAAALVARAARRRGLGVGSRIAIAAGRGAVAAARGDQTTARRAVARGLRLALADQSGLAALELRAAADRADGLVEVGVRLALQSGRASDVLRYVELPRHRWFALPAARPSADAELADRLAELRVASAELDTAIAEGRDAGQIAALRAAVSGREREVRARSRAAPAAASRPDPPVGRAIAALDGACLLDYAVVGGRLLVVSVVRGRIDVDEIGDPQAVAADIEATGAALHRLHRPGASPASVAAATRLLVEHGRRLDDRLIPARVARCDDPVVVVPAGALHGLAWSLLPSLRGRPVTVSPSFFGWVSRQDRAGRPRPTPLEPQRDVTVAAGPGLAGADAEVVALGELYPGATVLRGDAMTGGAVLDELGRRRLVHLACHGTFRADSPLFSTLQCADGPLTVHDLETCPALPDTLVASACNAGASAAGRGGSLLGVATALTCLGAGSIVAPLTAIDDELTAALMLALHRRLRAGDSAPEALAALAGTADVAPSAVFVSFG